MGNSSANRCLIHANTPRMILELDADPLEFSLVNNYTISDLSNNFNRLFTIGISGLRCCGVRNNLRRSGETTQRTTKAMRGKSRGWLTDKGNQALRLATIEAFDDYSARIMELAVSVFIGPNKLRRVVWSRSI